MRINLGDINRDEFVVEPRHHEGIGTLVLVRPKKIKHRWEQHELWLRSLLCREDGEVVSCGFPKFFNHGEDPASDIITEAGLAGGNVLMTEKVDGSLIIRSVVNGVVVLRTRGSHELGPFEDKVVRLIARKYPRILDPNVEPHYSFLFEFVDPEQPVCLRYPAAELYELGDIDHTEAVPTFWPARRGVSAGFGCPRPRLYDGLPAVVAELRAAVGDMQDEGVVVATCHPRAHGWHLSKFKSRRYLALHALRSNLTERKAWVYFAERGVASPMSLRSAFDRDGIDWEVGQVAMQWLPGYNVAEVAAYEAAIRIEDAMRPYQDRRGKAEAARRACEREGRPELFTVAMASLDSPERRQVAFNAAVCGISVSEYKAEVARLADLTKPVAEDDAA